MIAREDVDRAAAALYDADRHLDARFEALKSAVAGLTTSDQVELLWRLALQFLEPAQIMMDLASQDPEIEARAFLLAKEMHAARVEYAQFKTLIQDLEGL